MPVVHIRGNEAAAGQATTKSLGNVAEAVATALAEPPERVWCTFQTLSETTIGGRAAPGRGIVYVDVLMKGRGDSVERNALEAAAKAAAQSFQIPLEDVWARLVILRSGHVFSGGG